MSDLFAIFIGWLADIIITVCEWLWQDIIVAVIQYLWALITDGLGPLIEGGLSSLGLNSHWATMQTSIAYLCGDLYASYPQFGIVWTAFQTAMAALFAWIVVRWIIRLIPGVGA